jgi:hypothetical protein
MAAASPAENNDSPSHPTPRIVVEQGRRQVDGSKFKRHLWKD